MHRTPTAVRSFDSRSPEDTQAFGRRLGRRLNKGDVVMLVGNLGAGKTTFVQGVVAGAGVKGDVQSPTFILAQTFKGRIPLHHLDFYRVSGREIMDIGIEDYFTGRGEIPLGAVLIEWADRFNELWPRDRVEIKIVVSLAKDSRKIHVRGVGERSANLVKNL